MMIEAEYLEEWSGPGELIRFEENEDEEFVGFVPIGRVLAIIDPVAEPPWHDGEDVTVEGVQAALAEERFELRPYSSDTLSTRRDEWTARRHEERIAWILANPPSDPIGIEIDAYGDPQVDDGMHRLYAATVRRDTTIFIRIGGFLDSSPTAIGVVCVSAEMAEEPSEVVAL